MKKYILLFSLFVFILSKGEGAELSFISSNNITIKNLDEDILVTVKTNVSDIWWGYYPTLYYCRPNNYGEYWNSDDYIVMVWDVLGVRENSFYVNPNSFALNRDKKQEIQFKIKATNPNTKVTGNISDVIILTINYIPTTPTTPTKPTLPTTPTVITNTSDISSKGIYIDKALNSIFLKSGFHYKPKDASSYYKGSIVSGTTKSLTKSISVSKNEEIENSSVDNIEENSFSIFPNPTNGIININSAKLDENYLVRILDISGKSVYIDKLSSQKKEIDISDRQEGVYIIQIIDEDKVIYTKKFVKK